MVTPVPCVNVNFFDTDIENISLVDSPPSTAAFEPNDTLPLSSTIVWSASSLIMSFLCV